MHGTINKFADWYRLSQVNIYKTLVNYKIVINKEVYNTVVYDKVLKCINYNLVQINALVEFR